MDYIPMVWGAGNDTAAMTTYLLANPGIKYLLLMNEPNLVDQANLSPAAAAALWPKYEAIARATDVELVGPAITWGTLAGYSDPVVWMDAFIAAYKAANNGASPQIDYLAFHWYDYGLADQLDRLQKYGKPFWVTEMANWHSGTDGAQIDTLAKQKTQMTAMVKVCEDRADVFRYAWFIGRMSPDPHFTSLLGADGTLRSWALCICRCRTRRRSGLFHPFEKPQVVFCLRLFCVLSMGPYRARHSAHCAK